MKRKIVFIIQGYETEDQMGNLRDVCTIELIDTSVDKALERAKKLIAKKLYRVSNIIEKEV